ncbi:MAG: DUF4091 domain-containing protein [Oscillospiraceae bacterium]|jgi:hypothetical protein|nr:DUF4091 domain-containing protein [Oscillospiraceae bacterium]
MLQLIPLSSLEKVFSDEAPQAEPFPGCSCLRGEELSFQVAFCSDEDAELLPEMQAGGAGCECFLVEEIPSSLPCYADSDEFYLRKTPGPYPDLLRPITEPIRVKAGEWRSLWLCLRCEGDAAITITMRGQSVTCDFKRIPQDLPEQALLCTNWFHCDCLAQAYGAAPFGEAHWAIVENYVRCAAAHGINFLLTPLFTPPLDTEVGGERLTTQLVGVSKEGSAYSFDFTQLRRWFGMCERCGVKAFELSHLFTQWGAQHAPKIVDSAGQRIFGWETDADGDGYVDFLTQFAAALAPFLEQQGVKDRCYLHVSDEPGMNDIDRYARRAALIKRIFPGMKIIDALSNVEFYERGLLERPIPANDHIEPFIGRVPELWTYYCCGQHKGGVSNRFFAMPGWRTRVLGFQLWKFRCAGFLQWGFNFWNGRHSIEKNIDPFACTDGGEAWPSGDPFVVYPGGNGQPLLSLRLKLFHEALQDLRALQLLESKIGCAAALAILEQGLDEPITFSQYPRSASWLLETRERINKAFFYT